MKKFLGVLIICIVVIGGIYLIKQNPAIIENISDTINNLFSEPYEPYTKEFNVNSIRINNNDFYYNTLTEKQKSIYTSIANGIKELKNEIEIKDYEYINNDETMKDVEIAIHRFLLDHPEVFYLDEKYTVSTKSGIMGTTVLINFTYSVASIEELNEKLNLIESKANEIIEKSGINSENIFDSELKLHDLLAEMITYYEYEDINEIPNKYHNIDGAFLENIAVCDGISKAYQILLSKIGIESIVVTGDLSGVSHAWNMVKLDGNWYHVDVTSNCSVKADNKVVIHSYFNITTDALKKTHKITDEQLIPVANKEDYAYYTYLDKTITGSDNFSNKLKQILDSNENQKLIEFRVSGFDSVPDKIIDVLRKGRYTEYLQSNSTKFVYYNVLDTYIILRK